MVNLNIESLLYYNNRRTRYVTPNLHGYLYIKIIFIDLFRVKERYNIFILLFLTTITN